MTDHDFQWLERLSDEDLAALYSAAVAASNTPYDPMSDDPEMTQELWDSQKQSHTEDAAAYAEEIARRRQN